MEWRIKPTESPRTVIKTARSSDLEEQANAGKGGQ